MFVWILTERAWIAIGYVMYARFLCVHACLFVALWIHELEWGVTEVQLLKDDFTLHYLFCVPFVCMFLFSLHPCSFVCASRHKCTWGCPCLRSFWKTQSCAGWDTEYLHHCHFSTSGRQEAVDEENKSFVRMGQVETTTPFVQLQQCMDPVNEKRQGLTHFQYTHTHMQTLT